MALKTTTALTLAIAAFDLACGVSVHAVSDAQLIVALQQECTDKEGLQRPSYGKAEYEEFCTNIGDLSSRDLKCTFGRLFGTSYDGSVSTDDDMMSLIVMEICVLGH